MSESAVHYAQFNATKECKIQHTVNKLNIDAML